MNLADLRGGVIMRLGPRDKVPLAGVDMEINNAIRDILTHLRMVGNRRLDKEAYSDTIADLDIYPWPDDAEEIRHIFWLAAGTTPILMTRIATEEEPMPDHAGMVGTVMPFAYSQISERRIRLGFIPSSSTKNAIQWRYFPRPRRLVKASDVPDLPDALHECLIPPAVVRMASYEGIGLAHPASFDRYRQMMEVRLRDATQPESMDGGDHVLDYDPYYSGGY